MVRPAGDVQPVHLRAQRRLRPHVALPALPLPPIPAPPAPRSAAAAVADAPADPLLTGLNSPLVRDATVPPSALVLQLRSDDGKRLGSVVEPPANDARCRPKELADHSVNSAAPSTDVVVAKESSCKGDAAAAGATPAAALPPGAPPLAAAATASRIAAAAALAAFSPTAAAAASAAPSGGDDGSRSSAWLCAKKHTVRVQLPASLHISVRYFDGCIQDSNTPCANGHTSPRLHVPFRKSGHVLEVYAYRRGSRRRAFSPGCANGHSVQLWSCSESRWGHSSTWGRRGSRAAHGDGCPVSGACVA
eukprot:362952-Chlamydomonas_euryale.AAC.5